MCKQQMSAVLTWMWLATFVFGRPVGEKKVVESLDCLTVGGGVRLCVDAETDVAENLDIPVSKKSHKYSLPSTPYSSTPYKKLSTEYNGLFVPFYMHRRGLDMTGIPSGSFGRKFIDDTVVKRKFDSIAHTTGMGGFK
ncbi:uncharacterized protein LOC128245350 [Mya arenaria]|uniref:uncharacterized protein LOC128245350 n=1 Tax=Mya arenaria TaxID=6604 RepID=UPI0022E32D85|nr:uncharacterized protein LOC128245350 [Mya arenaria]